MTERIRSFYRRHRRPLVLGAGALLALLLVLVISHGSEPRRPPEPRLTGTALEIKVHNLGRAGQTSTMLVQCRGAQPLLPRGATASPLQLRSCQALEHTPPPFGEQQCRDGGQEPLLQATVRGSYRGRPVSGRYSDGPCPEGRRAWQRLAALWTMPNERPQVIRVFVIPPVDNPPARLLAKMQRYARLGQQRNAYTGDCYYTLAYRPWKSCWLQNAKGSANLTLQVTWKDIEQMLGASPQKLYRLMLRVATGEQRPGFPSNGPGNTTVTVPPPY